MGLMTLGGLVGSDRSLGRRAFLRGLAAFGLLAATAKDFFFSHRTAAQSGAPGLPLPDEPVEATLKRLFGNRALQSGDGKIKFELPLIAEDGGNVAISVDASLPVSGPNRVSSIYIVSDKNRRPMLAKFSFTPESGKAFIATSVRLATTTDVRAIVEISDGMLYAVSKNVRLTISGCDLPAQS